ncbi:MAG: hypothetical protein ABFS10_14815 [Bacteroidota bacterium]
MKSFKLLAITLIAAFMVTSCSKEEQFESDESLMLNGALKSAAVDIPIYPDDATVTWPGDDGCGQEVYALIGGQNIPMGTVSVITYDGDLYVKYELNEGSQCSIIEANLFLGDINDLPTGKNGNIKIGHFPYAWEDENGSDVVIMKIPEQLGCFSIVAHAVVKCGEDEETAWAKGDETIFALKSRMEVTEDWFRWSITGTPGTWCSNFIYLSLNEALGETIPLVYYNDGVTKYGEVSVALVGDIVQFTITSDNGDVNNSHLFVGSSEEWNSIDHCDHWSFDYQDNNEAPQHVFEFPAAILMDGASAALPGTAWGWYIPEYCMCMVI